MAYKAYIVLMSHDVYKVFLDTNVLFSKTLRDWTFLISYETQNKFFQTFTSQGVLDEWSYHWRKKHPEKDDKARQMIVDQIKKAVFEVVEGFPIHPIESYPDKHDLHVHAGALAAEVDALVTADTPLIEFGKTEAGEEQLSYDTYSPDEFLMQLTEYAPDSVFLNVYLQCEEYARKKSSDINLCQNLRAAGAPRFADYIYENIYLKLV